MLRLAVTERNPSMPQDGWRGEYRVRTDLPHKFGIVREQHDKWTKVPSGNVAYFLTHWQPEETAARESNG